MTSARFALAFLAVAAFAASGAALDDSTCISRGFVPSLCSTANCDKLGSFLKDATDELVKECKECCVGGVAVADGQLYDEAELIVCPLRYERLPEIQQFVEKVMPKFPSISATYTMNHAPTLVLKSDSGAKTSVSVAGWKVAQIQEFVQQKLRRE